MIIVRESKMDHPEKLSTYGTQDEVKHNKICVAHYHVQMNAIKLNYDMGALTY